MAERLCRKVGREPGCGRLADCAPRGRDGRPCPPEASGPRPLRPGQLQVAPVHLRRWQRMADGALGDFRLSFLRRCVQRHSWAARFSLDEACIGPLAPRPPSPGEGGRPHSRPLAAPWVRGEEHWVCRLLSPLALGVESICVCTFFVSGSAVPPQGGRFGQCARCPDPHARPGDDLLTRETGPVHLGRDFKGPVPPLPPQCRGRCPARSRGSRPFVNDACWPFAPCERPASHAHRSALPRPRGSGVQCGPGACPSPPPASSPACPSIRGTGVRTCVRVCTCA